MSFAEQERALFDLLFDASLRHQFIDQASAGKPSAALTNYQLSPTELADFDAIRPDGLAQDAALRSEQILLHFCRQLPVTFSLISAAPDGISVLQRQIVPTIMRSHPDQRVNQFGDQLRSQLANLQLPSSLPHELAAIFLDVELAMAWTGAALKQQLLNNQPIQTADLPVADAVANDWSKHPIKLADYVGVALLPAAYSTLKNGLCPVDDIRLWTHLRKQPTRPESVNKLLNHAHPTLFLSRAESGYSSRCEARVNHQTVELNDGFAALLQQLDGNSSVDQILQQLTAIGATAPVLKSVRTGFQKLLESGMIETV